MANDNNKDIASSLNKYTDYANRGTNIVLDSAENINKWYAEQLKKITESDIDTSRIETGVDNTVETNNNVNKEKEISTKVKQYSNIQTNNNDNKKVIKPNKVQTATENNEIQKDEKYTSNSILEKNNRRLNTSKKLSNVIKGVKIVNNSAQKAIRTGKDISSGLNENGTTAFKGTSGRIMTKPIKKVADKASNKITKETIKYTKKVTKKIGAKISENLSKKVVTKTTNIIIKIMKLLVKLMAKAVELILSMLPQIAPILIILVVAAAFCSFFGIGMSEDTKKDYENYMISTQQSYDKTTIDFYNSGKIVDGTIEGKGMINWRAPLSIIQMLNGDLNYDNAEKTILDKFKNAELYEKISDASYTYEKETDEVDDNENKIKETVTDTKKVVKNPSLEDYITWCNSNFYTINQYKKEKGLKVDWNQKSFTDNEVEQIKMLYNTNSFFELFSSEFKSTYAYLNVNIGDEQLRKIYEEFLRNAGTRYLMDHSNLKYDECMDYYDCSSWVIHCLAHTGIITIPNTGAEGIYDNYCYPVNENDRKAGDLIFLKDTYDTGEPGSISHIGIYMGTLTIDGETAEWVIDTGGNPSGVRIRKYNNGWWNGTNFYGFGRLKQ